VTETEIRAALDDVTALALTADAEARGDSREGHSSVEERIAVMSVIRTRARLGHRPIKEVCLAPRQFSCWNPGEDANHLRLLRQAERVVTHQLLDDLMLETLYLAEGVAGDVILDRVNGATHYFAPAAMVPPGRVPAWAQGLQPVAVVGRQRFYRLAGGPPGGAVRAAAEGTAHTSSRPSVA
jgi:hypothetical protein